LTNGVVVVVVVGGEVVGEYVVVVKIGVDAGGVRRLG
jgi:hypothetical protein